MLHAAKTLAARSKMTVVSLLGQQQRWPNHSPSYGVSLQLATPINFVGRGLSYPAAVMAFWELGEACDDGNLVTEACGYEQSCISLLVKLREVGGVHHNVVMVSSMTGSL